MPRIISAAKAYQYCCNWGSYMYSGDPGACMYGFKINDGRPKDEAHRDRCLAYIQNLLDNPINKYGKRRPSSYQRELIALRNWFRHVKPKRYNWPLMAAGAEKVYDPAIKAKNMEVD